ncbi:MAG: CidA/LrgA family protein [Candidatus Limiplasma sp.]|nr:CidA/LrgA family protein [Candidatus Limiplasma sp.]
MRILLQCGVIFAISFGGECLHAWLPLPIPAGVYGFGLLLAALMTKAVKLHQVEEVGQFFVSLLPLIFVPALVGLLGSPELPAQALLPIGLVVVVSTVVVMGVSGLVTQNLLVKRRRGG